MKVRLALREDHAILSRCTATRDVSEGQLITGKSRYCHDHGTIQPRYGTVLAENLRLSSSWNYRPKIIQYKKRTEDDSYLAV